MHAEARRSSSNMEPVHVEKGTRGIDTEKTSSKANLFPVEVLALIRVFSDQAMFDEGLRHMMPTLA